MARQCWEPHTSSAHRSRCDASRYGLSAPGPPLRRATVRRGRRSDPAQRVQPVQHPVPTSSMPASTVSPADAATAAVRSAAAARPRPCGDDRAGLTRAGTAGRTGGTSKRASAPDVRTRGPSRGRAGGRRRTRRRIPVPGAPDPRGVGRWPRPTTTAGTGDLVGRTRSRMSSRCRAERPMWRVGPPLPCSAVRPGGSPHDLVQLDEVGRLGTVAGW
jgi:hypothetical protein